MANDPLAPVVRGEVMAITASAWNEAMAVARDRRQPQRPRGADPRANRLGTVEALALNSTGAALREYKPAAVTDYGGYDVTADPAGADWQRRPLVTLGVPAAATDLVAVTLEAIPDGSIGRVAIAGYALCDVNHAGTPTHAGPTPTTTDYLTGGTSGPIRVIKWPSGVGSTRRAGVLLGDQIAAGAGGTPLNSQNTDGTQVDGTTTDIRFNKATGVQVTQGSGGTANQSLVTGIDAGPSQVGMVNTGLQAFEGEKRFLSTLRRTEASSGLSVYPEVLIDVVPSVMGYVTVTSASASCSSGLQATYSATVATATHRMDLGGVTRVLTVTEKADASTYASTFTEWRTGRLLGGNPAAVIVGGVTADDEQGVAFCAKPSGYSFDIYADISEWAGGTPNTGPVRHRQNSVVADGSAWGARRAGTDHMGIDAVEVIGAKTFSFKGGLLVSVV